MSQLDFVCRDRFAERFSRLRYDRLTCRTQDGYGRNYLAAATATYSVDFAPSYSFSGLRIVRIPIPQGLYP